MMGSNKGVSRPRLRSPLFGVMISILLIPLLLGACQSQKAKAQGIGEDMINLNLETGYFALQDFRSDELETISVGITDSGFKACAQILSDFLVLFWGEEEKANTLPTVRRYDDQGKILWEKGFDIPDMDNGSTGKLIPFKDGFLLSLSRWPYYHENGMIYPKQHLIRCDGDGNILWHEALESYSGELMQQVFTTGDGEIITVGCGEKRIDAPSDLVVMRFDENGKMLRQISIGGSDFERLICAAYKEGLGLVLGYHSQSQPGEGYYLACFDPEFNQVWQYEPYDEGYFGDFSLAMGEECLYLMGNAIKGQNRQGIIIKLDSSGKEIWREISPKLFHSMAVLDDGNIALSGSEGDKDFLLIKSPDNETLYALESRTEPSQMQIFPVEGGFMAISRRMIKTVPQPVYISSIWYDTEVTATRYDNRLQMLWRKTFDRYRNTRETDLVYPLRDGRLLVE